MLTSDKYCVTRKKKIEHFFLGNVFLRINFFFFLTRRQNTNDDEMNYRKKNFHKDSYIVHIVIKKIKV